MTGHPGVALYPSASPGVRLCDSAGCHAAGVTREYQLHRAGWKQSRHGNNRKARGRSFSETATTAAVVFVRDEAVA